MIYAITLLDKPQSAGLRQLVRSTGVRPFVNLWPQKAGFPPAA